MAELGIIASVVQLAGAAIVSARTLCDLVDTIKHAPEEIKAIDKDARAFERVVSSVETALQDTTVQHVVIGDTKLSEVVEGLEGPLRNCSVVISQLQPRIRSHLKTTADGGLKVKNRVEATKSTFDAALTSVVFLCSLRAAGHNHNAFPAMRTLQDECETDAGSALIRYAESVAPRSPPLHVAFDQTLTLEEPLTQQLTKWRANSNPAIPENTVPAVDRLRKAENQRTGLHKAATDGDDLIVQIIIEEGCDINVRASDGRTALHLAAEHGHGDVVQTLLSNNAHVNARSKPNHMGTYEERYYRAGRTPLHCAAAEGHESVVRLLLKHHADMNVPNATGRSTLQDAICNSRDEIALLLIGKDTSLTNKDGRGWTPLHEASSGGRLAVMQAIVLKATATDQRSAVLDAKTNGEDRGWFMSVTPIFLAILNNRFPCIRFLLDCGASFTQTWGDTPLHAACMVGNLPFIEEMLRDPIVGDICIEVRDPRFSETPLLKAASRGRADVIHFLLGEGANLDARDYQGRNALELAKEHPQAVEVIEECMYDSDAVVPRPIQVHGRHNPLSERERYFIDK